jgi:hypothetical protein
LAHNVFVLVEEINMAIRTQKHAAVTREPQILKWVRHQALLVPEAIVLLLVLSLHITFGGPLLTALLGLGVIIWFVCRGALLLLAKQAFDAAYYRRAARLSTFALMLYPFSADALALRSSICLARDQAAEAERMLRRAIACCPDLATLHAALSGVLLETGHPAEALWEAHHALLLAPECALAHLHLAQAEKQLGASLETVEQGLRAGLRMQLDAADEAALRCALAALLLEQNRLPEAQLVLAGIEALLEDCSAPQRAGLHYHLGDLQRALGNADSARNHFLASETLDPYGRYAAAAWRAARS